MDDKVNSNSNLKMYKGQWDITIVPGPHTESAYFVLYLVFDVHMHKQTHAHTKPYDNSTGHTLLFPFDK